MSKSNTAFLAVIVTVLTGSLIINPQASLEASTRGLEMWWEVVFPSLLPFFIASDLLISLRVVHFIGILLEPLMRPLFRVPGVGGFVWAMGMASGFPSGAKLSARLRSDNQLTQIEAERLVSFTNSSSPLFIFGAVAVGFFHNPDLGMILAVSHYSSNVATGLIMRFHGSTNTMTKQRRKHVSIGKIFQAFQQKHPKETRPLGKLLGDAIASSIQTLLVIGGFIILFSVLNKMLELLHITALIIPIIQYLLELLQLPSSFGNAIISGIFEITLGNHLTSQAEATLFQQTMVASFLLAFSGLSVQAQVASILAETDIRFLPYFFARVLQSILAPIATFLLWGPLYENKDVLHYKGTGIPVLAQPLPDGFVFFHTYGPLVTLFFLYVYLFLLFRKKG
ncbi:sporulation integral membrane protein YlbJ [Ectobacillus sp. sgz5001026]|uniref:sporulation integral membrane protein YlbJ n=1 Tax=Ectobacillus sp. sgz5001026 TaxID=3242473 RepID=UPI0036D306BC